MAVPTADFLSIDRGIASMLLPLTGNSMGWYITLACAGAAGEMSALSIINTMGGLMQEALIGGQLLYPLVDEDWRAIPGRKAELLGLIDEIGNTAGNSLYPSIHLGGFLVFGGTAPALDALESRLKPEQGRFPLRLANHAAFHTPLQRPIAERGQDLLGPELFGQPTLPMIDGRGHVWTRHGSAPDALRDYTLGHQVIAPYDLPYLVDVGVSDQIVSRGLANTFRLGPGFGVIAQTALDNLVTLNESAGSPARTVMIVHEDSLFGSGLAGLLNEQLPDRGFEVLETIPHATPQRDFNNVALRIRAADPDLIIPANYYNEYVLLPGPCSSSACARAASTRCSAVPHPPTASSRSSPRRRNTSWTATTGSTPPTTGRWP